MKLNLFVFFNSKIKSTMLKIVQRDWKYHYSRSNDLLSYDSVAKL